MGLFHYQHGQLCWHPLHFVRCFNRERGENISRFSTCAPILSYFSVPVLTRACCIAPRASALLLCSMRSMSDKCRVIRRTAMRKLSTGNRQLATATVHCQSTQQHTRACSARPLDRIEIIMLARLTVQCHLWVQDLEVVEGVQPVH